MAIKRYTQNPNEIHGVRACMAVGQQKGHDCGGEWLLFEGIKVFNPAAPLAVVCTNCLEAFAKKGGDAARLGFAGVPEARGQRTNTSGKCASEQPTDFPGKIVEVSVEKPKRRRAKRSVADITDEELSL